MYFLYAPYNFSSSCMFSVGFIAKSPMCRLMDFFLAFFAADRNKSWFNQSGIESSDSSTFLKQYFISSRPWWSFIYRYPIFDMCFQKGRSPLNDPDKSSGSGRWMLFLSIYLFNSLCRHSKNSALCVFCINSP